MPAGPTNFAELNASGSARSGIIVLPSGAGKSLVGVSAASRIKKSCLCLATNAVKERFRGNVGVVVTTYNMVAFGGKRSEESEKIIEEIRNRERGLLLMDEVHVVPAHMFRKVISITKSHCKLVLTGTACIIALTDQGLHAINLGDSGFMLVRDGSTVFGSPVQQHDFNFTYQLESGNAGDSPSSGEVFKIPVAPGDVIIAGTDGLFDNLYNNDISAVVGHATRAGLPPQVVAQKIAALARQRAQDQKQANPFSAAAQEAGFRYHGGKLDDVTMVVAYITSEKNTRISLHLI
ncbi:probable protein phosphatase 2C 55 [Capsicum annuum]|uniref:probable protein phosphatase 2C 55 n=1 Tax=Capsicum annuum TaxID=4072 RepID=UPI001FB14C18|nr:probable protein phosphatase 2C 55 [Capsicum annuum]